MAGVALLCAPAVAGAAPIGHLHRWRAPAPGVAGGIRYGHGEVSITDTPFDDHGGDLRPNADPSEGTVGPYWGANAAEGNVPGATGGANGDYEYPAEKVYARNAADIVETRVAENRRAWFLLVRLNMLGDPARTAVEARIDGHTLLVHGATATFDGTPVKTASDTQQAFFEVRVPRAVFDPGRGTHHLFVAAGLWDTAADDWLAPAAGKPPWFDLAHVPDEGMDSYWRDARQSADIASGSVDGDAVDVDFGALRRPSYQGPRTGLFSRVFRSRQKLGNGVVLQPRYAQDTGTYPPNLYRSPTQPYAIYVPKHRTGALVLLLHFLAGNHMSFPLTSAAGMAAWAEKLGAVVAMPLARGEGGWYEGEAEKDVFEVWHDVRAHYRIDPDRVYLAGMSMGGFGTWRLAQLHPDLFARAIVWAGPMTPNTIWAYPSDPPQPSCGAGQPKDCGYNLMELFGNTLNVPLYVVHGGADSLVPASGPEHWMSVFAQDSGAPFRYRFYPDRQHETSFPGETGEVVLDWLGGLPRRVRNPVHVRYTVVRRIGVRYDHAYWARGLVLADGAASGTLDASRTAAPDKLTPLPDTPGADDLGPYRLSGQDVAAPAPAADTVVLHAKGLARVVLDTRRMGWSRTGPWHVSGDTDRPLEVVLAGRTRHRTLRVAAGRFDRLT